MQNSSVAVPINQGGLIENPNQWKSNITNAKTLHQHFKFHLIALIGMTLLAEIGVIIVGGKYINMNDSITTTWGTVTAAGIIKVAGTVIPQLRNRAMNKLKEEGKELEALSEDEAKEIGILLHKITMLADTDSRQFDRRIQSLWTLFPAIAAGTFEAPYKYVSTAIAGFTGLFYIGSDWYHIVKAARKADKLFAKLELTQTPGNI